MTPTPPELSPEQEAEVRALLAGAREAGPVPEEVLARLEDTLADLRREAPPTAPVAPVVPIASRRRRTLAATLVAAAAVVVGGVGIGQVLPGGGGGGDTMVAADRAEDSTAGDGSGATERSAGAAAEDPADSSDSSDSSAGRDGAFQDQSGVEGFPGAAPEAATSAKQRVYALRSDTLDRDVRTVRRAARGTELTSDPLRAVCDVPDAGSGRRIAVTLDEIPALLVLRSPDGDRQRGDIYLCGATEIERTVWLPAN